MASNVFLTTSNWIFRSNDFDFGHIAGNRDELYAPYKRSHRTYHSYVVLYCQYGVQCTFHQHFVGNKFLDSIRRSETYGPLCLKGHHQKKPKEAVAKQVKSLLKISLYYSLVVYPPTIIALYYNLYLVYSMNFIKSYPEIKRNKTKKMI
jgi:hypothetical protein